MTHQHTSELEHAPAAAPHAQASLLAALAELQGGVHAYFAAIPADDFVHASRDEWSPAQHLDHLIKAVAPLEKALGLPKLSLRMLFGRGAGTSQGYEAIQTRYSQALAAGAQASGRYLPAAPAESSAAPTYKEELLRRWKTVTSRLIAVLGRWNEQDLDRYLLPHPILGPLTIREMMFFTIYHTTRHITAGGD